MHGVQKVIERGINGPTAQLVFIGKSNGMNHKINFSPFFAEFLKALFNRSAVGNIAGSYVTDGMFQRGCKIRITRAGEQIYEGELASLKRFKDDVKEVKAGYECGLVFEKFDAMAELDIVEAYIMVEVPR